MHFPQSIVDRRLNIDSEECKAPANVPCGVGAGSYCEVVDVPSDYEMEDATGSTTLYVRDGQVRNNMALNRRVLGGSAGTASLSNNLAFEGMLNHEDEAVWSHPVDIPTGKPPWPLRVDC